MIRPRPLFAILALATACVPAQPATLQLDPRYSSAVQQWRRDSVLLLSQSDSLRAMHLRIAQLEGQIVGMGSVVPAPTAAVQQAFKASTSPTARADSSAGAGTEPATPRPPASAPTRGPKGGCYVITGSGKKRYVDRSRC